MQIAFIQPTFLTAKPRIHRCILVAPEWFGRPSRHVFEGAANRVLGSRGDALNCNGVWLLLRDLQPIAAYMA